MTVKRKEESIETLRGIAIILMVAGHVIGVNSTTGLNVEDSSVWRYFYYSFEYLRMPLFTAISGYVYAIKPVQGGNVRRFLGGKSRRILLPFVSVATVQYILNALVPSVNNPTDLGSIWRIYIFGYGQFWFLQSLFLVFLTITVLEYFKVTTTFRGWLLSFAAAVAGLFLISPLIDVQIFNCGNYLYLLPFFVLGMGINRFSEIIYARYAVAIMLLLLIGGLAIQQMNWFGLISLPSQRFGILGIFVGLTGIYLIFHIRRTFSPLADLGYYAYGIYLFHVFGTASSRIFSKALGIENLLSLFIIGMVFGLGVPIILEKYILLKSKFLKRVFLGLK